MKGYQNCKRSIPIIKDYKLVIRSKGVLNDAYKQGLLFKKFKDSNKFEQMFQEIEMSKSTVYFKVKLVKLLNNLKIKCSYLSLEFFKDYAKTIKEICKESRDQFKQNYDSIILNG